MIEKLQNGLEKEAKESLHEIILLIKTILYMSLIMLIITLIIGVFSIL